MIETMPAASAQQNILIVDDDPELRRLIGEFLGKLEWQPHIGSKSRREAIASARPIRASETQGESRRTAGRGPGAQACGAGPTWPASARSTGAP